MAVGLDRQRSRDSIVPHQSLEFGRAGGQQLRHIGLVIPDHVAAVLVDIDGNREIGHPAPFDDIDKRKRQTPAAGRVTYAGKYRSFGQIVIIEHGGGWTSLVTNLASLNVRKGASIAQGAQLGRTRVDQSEITLELRRNGRVMDIAALVS